MSRSFESELGPSSWYSAAHTSKENPFVLDSFICRANWRWLSGRFSLGLKLFQGSFDFEVTRKQFVCGNSRKTPVPVLTQHMFLLEVAAQGVTDGFHRLLAVMVTVAGKIRSVAFAGNDGTHNLHAGNPCDVGDHMMQLYVLFHQGFLHVMDPGGARFKQSLALFYSFT